MIKLMMNMMVLWGWMMMRSLEFK